MICVYSAHTPHTVVYLKHVDYRLPGRIAQNNLTIYEFVVMRLCKLNYLQIHMKCWEKSR